MAKRTPRKKRPSMKDVASLAGVSSTTVSFVINDVPHSSIPDETKAKVWAAVRELNYRPNIMARGLRAQQTHTIGFVSDEVATSPFAGRMLLGAQELAWEHGYLLLVINTGSNKSMEQAAVQTLLDRQADGILYATFYHRQVAPPEEIREVPTVLVDCFVADGSLPAVFPDEINSAINAVQHLIENGHTRIGFINDQNTVPAAVGRLEGYRNALSAHALPFDESLICNDASNTVGGYRAATALLTRADRPTALFCFNDRMAMGAYQVASELGLSIPNDLSIVGFDNQEVIASSLRPSLTTMELPHLQMGRWAVQYLLNRIQRKKDEDEASQHILACPLISRGSVAPIGGRKRE